MMNDKTSNTAHTIFPTTEKDGSAHSLGSLLSTERQNRNLSIRAIAQQMKIPENFITALEADQYDVLPGATFTQGYLRAYFRILEIDEKKVETLLKSVVTTNSEKNFIISGMPKRSKTISIATIFTATCTVIVLVILGLAGTWVYHNHILKKTMEATKTATISPPKLINKFTLPAPSGSRSLASKVTHQNYPTIPGTKHG